jgi:hypothetical protein
MASGLSFKPYTVGISGDMVEIQGLQHGESCGQFFDPSILQ